jgi:hypothetical protein
VVISLNKTASVETAARPFCDDKCAISLQCFFFYFKAGGTYCHAYVCDYRRGFGLTTYTRDAEL